MNKAMIDFARREIKKGLLQLEIKHRVFFKRLYSHGNLDKPTQAIVDDIPEEKLSWALTQIQNSLKKQGAL